MAQLLFQDQDSSIFPKSSIKSLPKTKYNSQMKTLKISQIKKKTIIKSLILLQIKRLLLKPLFNNSMIILSKFLPKTIICIRIIISLSKKKKKKMKMKMKIYILIKINIVTVNTVNPAFKKILMKVYSDLVFSNTRNLYNQMNLIASVLLITKKVNKNPILIIVKLYPLIIIIKTYPIF